MSSNDSVLRARASLGVASRHSRGGSADPSAIAEAKRNLTAAKLERAIREAVAAAPPLTDAQRHDLAGLLTATGDDR